MIGKRHDMSQLDNSSLSNPDLCHKITKSLENSPLKSYEKHQKQGNCRRECKEDELVRYMSNLPGYLEKGESSHEKFLNVGVLDWASLEQWQCSHQHMPHINSRSSTSTSNISMSVSTDRLSGYSSRTRSLSPSCQRICHPPLPSQFMASAKQVLSQDAQSFGKILEKCQNIRGSHKNSKTHIQFVRANDHLSQNVPNSRLNACSKKDLDPKIVTKRGVLSEDQMYEAASCIKLEMSTQDGELENRIETFCQPTMITLEQDVLKENKPFALCLPRDILPDGHSGISDLLTFQSQKSQVPSQTSFVENPEELSVEDINNKKSNSFTLPNEVTCSHSQAKGCSSIDAGRIRVHPATFSTPLSTRMRISPSRSRKAEKKQPTATISSAKELSQELTQKVSAEKSRSSSPFCQFSFSIGFASKGSGCKEDALLPHRSSTGTVKSSSVNMRGCSSSDMSGNGKAGEAGRSRSSPLRRLLDPLLKPKAVNCHHSLESSLKDPLLINKNCVSANGKSPPLQLEKELIKNHRDGYSTSDTDDSSKNKKHVSSTVQALLRIAMKNGLPMFTFAVDKDNSILAATVKKLGTIEKDGCSCIYSFFTFREVNKKAGNWIKQAGKCKGLDYIHHIVAKMKVSNSHFFDLAGQNCVGSSTVKEFVLYPTKLKQGDDEAPGYQPDDELAAIIVKIPKTMGFTNDGHHSSSCDNRQELVRATVVLPSGVHSHPGKGGPSSLIERWKSGGSCDCGGWDMGCELKILANENPAGRKSRSSEAYCEDQFELFLQGNGREHRPPVFSFAPFKRGIFSVVYDSSLSLLQAFSICIALVDCKMPWELSGSGN